MKKLTLARETIRTLKIKSRVRAGGQSVASCAIETVWAATCVC